MAPIDRDLDRPYLKKEIGFVASGLDFLCLLLKDLDEHVPDNLAFPLRVVNPTELL